MRVDPGQGPGQRSTSTSRGPASSSRWPLLCANLQTPLSTNPLLPGAAAFSPEDDHAFSEAVDRDFTLGARPEVCSYHRFKPFTRSSRAPIGSRVPTECNTVGYEVSSRINSPQLDTDPREDLTLSSYLDLGQSEAAAVPDRSGPERCLPPLAEVLKVHDEAARTQRSRLGGPSTLRSPAKRYDPIRDNFVRAETSIGNKALSSPSERSPKRSQLKRLRKPNPQREEPFRLPPGKTARGMYLLARVSLAHHAKSDFSLQTYTWISSRAHRKHHRESQCLSTYQQSLRRRRSRE